MVKIDMYFTHSEGILIKQTSWMHTILALRAAHLAVNSMLRIPTTECVTDLD